MTLPQRGDKITFVLNGNRLVHGTVTSRKDDVFFFRPAWSFETRLSATDAQEDCVWTRGYLRWWRPADRERKKALIAAHGLGDESVGVPGSRISFDETLEAAERALMQDMRKLAGDAKKLSDDAARLWSPVNWYPSRYNRRR